MGLLALPVRPLAHFRGRCLVRSRLLLIAVAPGKVAAASSPEPVPTVRVPLRNAKKRRQQLWGLPMTAFSSFPVRILAASAIGAFLALAPPGTLVQLAHAQREQVSAEFRTALEPHGEWRRSDRWGEVWSPRNRAGHWRTAGGPTPKIGAGTGTQQTMKPIGAGASTTTGAGRPTLTSVGYGYRGGNGLLLG